MWNPVCDRELRSLGRGAFLFGLRASYVALLSFIVLVGWQQTTRRFGVMPMSSRPNIPFDEIPVLGRALFELFCWGELVLVAAIGPILTARLITEERERRTLEILQSSAFSSIRIALGKFQVGWYHLLFLILAGMPVLGVTALLGGVSIEEVLVAMVLLACVASLASASGLLASAWCPRTAGAVLASYPILLGAHGLLTSATVGLGMWQGLVSSDARLDWFLVPLASPMEGPGQGEIGWLLNPVLALAANLNPDDFPGALWGGTWGSWLSWLPAPGATVLLTGIMLADVSLRIRRDERRPDRLRPVVRGATRLLPVILRLPLLRHCLDRVNPCAARHWREQESFTAMASLVGLGIVSAGAAGFPDSSESGLACGSIRWFSLVAGLTTMAMFAVVAASVFARERDRRTLDVAMVCPNGPRRLLAGLLLVPQVQVTLFALLGFILTAAIEGSFPYGPEAVFWLSVWVYGTAIAVLGVLISVLVTSPTRSMVGTLGIVVGLSAAPLIVEWLGVLVPGAESPAMAQAASLLSPYQNLAGCFHWPREKGMDLPISLLGALAVTILCVRVVLWSGERLTRRSGT